MLLSARLHRIKCKSFEPFVLWFDVIYLLAYVITYYTHETYVSTSFSVKLMIKCVEYKSALIVKWHILSFDL